jgi:uncharacterized protein
MRPARFAITVSILAFATLSLAAEVPYLSGRVVDNAEILKAETRSALSDTLKAHEDRTTDQIAVLTVRTIGSDSIEEYATRVFENWKLGKKGKDNGVLIVVVPDDHKMRIEVGYGLEGTLTDVQSSRIIRNVMTPAFKGGDYDGGVKAGVDAVIATLEGKATAAADAATSSTSSSTSKMEFIKDEDLPPWPMRILLGAFIFGVIGLFTWVGVMTPSAGWFLYFFLIPFWAMFPIIILGVRGALTLLGVYVIGFPIAKLIVSRQPWYQKAKTELKTTGHATVGGFNMSTSGSGSSSSWSSGGDSGGGFSGGGGSSGGGGASGSW